MTINKRARCPLCTRTIGTFEHNGRRIYMHHNGAGSTNASMVCEASGWLVEDDELVVVPRKTRCDAGVARPSRSTR